MKGRFCLASVLIIAGTAVASTGLAAPSIAGTESSNLSVSATVIPNCTISAFPVTFGNYDPIVANFAADQGGGGTVLTSCTTGSPATITLGQGANPNGGSSDSTPLRRMAFNSNRLEYFLYQDLSKTTVWGNTPATGLTTTGTGNPSPTIVYGKIPAGQNVPVGTYTDTVVATVTF